MTETVADLPEIPASHEAETTVLASVIYHPDIFPEIRPLLRPQSFFSADYGVIFESMCALADAGKPVTGELVCEHLKTRGLFQEIGGAKTLRQLIEAMPTPSFADHFARVVAQKAKLRELIRLAGELSKRCYAKSRMVEPAEDIAKWFEHALSEIVERGHRDTIRPLSEVVMETIEAKENKHVDRIATGIDDLDAVCGGLPIEGQTLVAGKAGMGKSQILKQFMRNIAERGIPCGIVSIEESGRKIAENYLAGSSGIENNKIVYNNLSAEEFGEIVTASAQLSRLPIFIDDAQHRLSEIERTVRRMVRKHKCRVIAVDHLHLIDGEYDGPREQELTRISGGLKRLWRELKVAGVVAAQLNRGGERETPPQLENLRGSGSLEQDGDLILLLHRPDYYEWKKKGRDFTPTHELQISVDKNKSGPVGHAKGYFDGDSQTVTAWNDGYGPYKTVPTFAVAAPTFHDPFEN